DVLVRVVSLGEGLVDDLRVGAVALGGLAPNRDRVAARRRRRERPAADRSGDFAGSEAEAGDDLERAEVLERLSSETRKMAGEQLGVVGGLTERDQGGGVRQRRAADGRGEHAKRLGGERDPD